MKSTDSGSQWRLPVLFAFVGKLITILALSGCVSIGTPAVAESREYSAPRIKQTTQVIIKFRDPALQVPWKEYLRKLAQETGVKLVYVRPMSGDAHVLRVEGDVNADRLQRLVDALAKRPEVDYAEPDRLMRRMSP